MDLTRYGRFTDHVLDFGAADQNKPDLHIIYGPNEAGKSTTFSALLDLLFGIEHKSRYNFLHPYPAMKIGASLQMQGVVQELVRTKA
ncbi:AAA family ATPase, partial [Ochrobactrum sp. SFR4]|uniref:AAA family ATPase n=1 Tax=Ochrobactrum sp. SFR4 TaxID=2717368 RepID=UPI00257035D4